MTKLALEEMFYVAARVHSAVDATFAHWEDVPDVVHNELFRAHLQEIAAGSERFAFMRSMQSYLARLNNAHTEFRDAAIFENAVNRFPVRLRSFGGQWHVTRSTDRSIRAGERIVAVNGLEPELFFAPHLKLVSASKAEYRSYQLFNRQFLLPDEFHVELQSGAGKLLSKAPPEESPNREPPVAGVQVGRHWVIAIRSWERAEYEAAALDLVRLHRTQPVLVIDVRGNSGGTTPQALIGKLMDRPYPGWMEATPFRLGLGLAESYPAHGGRLAAGRTPRAALSWSSVWNEPDEDGYRGRLVILADIGSMSATEDFLMPFKVTGRATIIGEATAGSSGQPYRESPAAGCAFSVGAKRQMFPDGSRFEGVGVAPDIGIDPLSACRCGSDLALTEALAFIC